MKNAVQDGDVLDFTAPAGGVTSGVPVLIGSILVVPVASADAGAKFAGHTNGVYSFDKVATQAWTAGDTVYWDDSEDHFTKTASGNYKAGIAYIDVAGGAGDTTGQVRLDGVATAAEA